MMKRLFVSLAAALASLTVWAQSSIRVEVHNIVEEGERFNLAFVVEGENSPSSFEWEAGEDFSLVWGPQKGTSTSVQIINGKTTRSSQTSYTYILQARKTGTFTIAPATAKVKGTEIHSKPVTIQVVSGGSGAASSQPQEPGKNASAQPQQNTGEADIFMRLSLNRSSVVLGEPVTATLKIYHRANLAGFEDAHFPAFKGFWSQEVESPSNIEFQREQVNGTMYNAAVLRRWVLIPQKSGDIAIDPAEIVCLVNVQRRRAGTSIFDDFFGTDYATIRQRVRTQGSTLHVSALPAGAPKSFHGGVGDFHIQARLSADSLKTHDAASLILTVSGKGNVALLEAPKLAFPPDFEVYDVKTTVKTDKSGTSGSKTFEYPFIPRSAGEFSIGPVEYGYFDAGKRRYEVAVAPALQLIVARSASATGEVPDGGGNTLVVDRKGVKNLGEDIRFIRSKTSLGQGNSFLVYSKAWWGCIIGILLAAFGFWAGFRKVAARRADVAGSRNRRATREALKRLSQAREFLQKNLYTAFYEELHRSLLGFAGDKLGLNMAEMDKEHIAETLCSRSVPEGVARDFVDLLDECEKARYSPDAGHDAMASHYEKAVTTITQIDASMKKPSSGSGAAATLLALLLVLPLGLNAQELSYPDSLWTAGVNAYTEGDFEGARKNWEEVLGAGLSSKELYYNLGNACFKGGELAPAILWWERARRLDPSDKDILHNLEYARALTQDRIDEVPEIFFEQWGHTLCYLLPSNTWAVLCLVFLALTAALVLLFLLGTTPGRRKLGFFAGIAAFIIAFLGWDFAQWQRQEALRQDQAIVMKPVSAVKSSPSEGGAKDLFILHEGTRVKILDNVSGYSNIELADGRQGWIPAGDIEII